MKNIKRFNFSGHPVAGFEIAPLVGANISLVAEEASATIREILLSLPGREELLRGEPAEIILPGMSWVAGLLVAEWHGQFGHFPRIRWSVRGDTGFVWPEEAKLDLASVRESARTAR